MKYLLLVSLSVLFFAFTYGSAPKEFTTNDLGLIIAISTLALAVQCGIAWVLRRKSVVQNVFLGLAGFVNIATLHLVFNEDFIGFGPLLVGLSAVVAVFIIQALMAASGENKRIGGIVSGAMLAIAAFTFVTAGASEPVVDEGAPEAGMTSADNVKLVEFERTPNIYFIGYDSIIPEVIAQKYLGVEALPYHEVLRAHTRRIPNLFADRTPTRRSLNTLLSFERRYTIETQGKGVWYGFFTGNTRSPLFEILKANGYETTTLFQNNYFGEKGPHVDNYIINTDTGVCDFIDENLRRYSFFGYCTVDKKLAANPLLTRLGLASGPISDPHDFLMDVIRRNADRDSPQFIMAHIYSPGHTDKAYDHEREGMFEAFRDDHIRKSETAATYMDTLFTFLREEDPTAIAYIYGDHGMWISRKSELPEDAEFYVTDRHAIAGGLWPADACADELAEADKLDFRTNTIMAQTVVACLAGEHPVKEFVLDEYQLTLPNPNVPKDFRSYSYE